MRTIYMHIYKQEHEEKKGAKEHAQVASEANLKKPTPLAVTSKRKPKRRGGGGAGNVVATVATHCVGHSEWECGSTDPSVAASGVAQATWFANGRYVEARAVQEEAETAQETARAIAAAADAADAAEESEVAAALASVAAAEAKAAAAEAKASAAEAAAAQQAAEEEEELAALAQVAAAVAAGEEEEDEEEEEKYLDSQKNDAQAAEALFLSRFGLG